MPQIDQKLLDLLKNIPNSALNSPEMQELATDTLLESIKNVLYNNIKDTSEIQRLIEEISNSNSLDVFREYIQDFDKKLTEEFIKLASEKI